MTPHTLLQTTLPAADTSAIAQKLAYFTQTPPGQIASDLLHSAVAFGLKLLGAVAIYVIGYLLVRLLRKAVNRAMEKRKVDDTLKSFTNSSISIVSTVLLLILCISILGVDTTSIAALLAAGGVAVGMALSGTLQNFAGGIMLIIFKPFKAGDYIKAQEQEGFVKEVTIVHTKIRTYDNRIIIIPNGILFNGTIDNYTQRVRRLDWRVQVAYGSDYEKARDVLYGILAEEERILPESHPGASAPLVSLGAFNDSSIEIVVRAWVRMADYWSVRYQVNEMIYKRLPENGIHFPFPQMDVHIKA